MRKNRVIGAFAILALGSLALPSVADARGVHVREVRLQDRCDPASFNEAIPSAPGDPPTCIPHGGQKTVTFGQFLAKLNPMDFGHPKWNNHPDELDLKQGDEISVVVRGGEFHTFTEVDEFGGGCIPFINEALGLADPGFDPADCDPHGSGLIIQTGVLPNGLSTLHVGGLDEGTHKFMCLIHPWMKTVVEVEDD
jgi:plastocyanin